MKQCDIDDETIALLCVIVLVLILIAVRACIPMSMHHPSEWPRGVTQIPQGD